MARGKPSDYMVAIPSYRRPALLADRTLPMLLNGGVDRDRIHVFIHEHDPDRDDYKALADTAGISLYVSDTRGITEQRANIANGYEPGEPVVSMDDDLIGLDQLASDGKTLERITDVDSLIRSMFTATSAADLNVWGLTPVRNSFYMRAGCTNDLKFLIGNCYGFYARPGHPVHQLTVTPKEDYEFSLRAWWWDGGVLRRNDVVAHTHMGTTPGGLQTIGDTQRSDESNRAAVAQLHADWPGLVRDNPRRPGEILLARQKRGPARAVTTPPPGRTA